LGYRRSLLGVNVDSAIDMPKYIGGSLLFAVKIKGFYLAGGGFLHFRVSDEIIKNYSSSSRIRARDYGLSGSMGYISTSHFKWFAGILCRYSPSLSEDKYYESLGYHTMRQFSFGFEAGIGF
jgi:hypothetical protein